MLQKAADKEHLKLLQLTGNDERKHQRGVWFEAAHAAQSAVTRYAQTKRLNRYEVEKELRHGDSHATRRTLLPGNGCRLAPSPAVNACGLGQD
ncbi:hypothetical protein ABZ864_40955 [Streptomyces sp. NPDC047082]|uniref:hypothetical protein n=1 Tax=Streptomyces sp. NPDC047082 TaxID=3155259 RepID=UPI0033FE9C91